jgi:hypothetical protein
MDYTQVMVDVNLLWQPLFDIKVLKEDAETMTYIDMDGVTRIYLKHEATIPTAIDWPVKDKQSWEQLKHERLSLGNLTARFPQN